MSKYVDDRVLTVEELRRVPRRSAPKERPTGEFARALRAVKRLGKSMAATLSRAMHPLMVVSNDPPGILDSATGEIQSAIELAMPRRPHIMCRCALPNPSAPKPNVGGPWHSGPPPGLVDRVPVMPPKPLDIGCRCLLHEPSEVPPRSRGVLRMVDRVKG